MYWLARNKPYLMASLSGLLLAASFPPSPLSFLAYLGFVPLLLVIDHTPDKVFEDPIWGSVKGALITFWRAITLQFLWRFRGEAWVYRRRIIGRYAQIFRYGYTTFLIWNIGGCYWLMLTALGVESPSEKIAAMSAGLMANLVNPFLMAIPLYFFSRLRRASQSFLMSLSFVFFWLSFEWLHFHWELSWSWLTLGHSQTMYPAWIQYIEFTGVLGISAHILLVNVVLYQLVRAWELKRQLALPMAALLAALLLVPILLNPIITRPGRAVFQASDSLKVRIIQPNIDPYEKFSGTPREQVALFYELINQPGIDSIDFVILPETAIPRPVWNDRLRQDDLMEPLWTSVFNEQVSLLTGLVEIRYIDPKREAVPASARPYRGDGLRNPGFYDYYNATAMLRPDSSIQTFQKGKLVPFVERVPYLETLSFLKNLNIDLGGSFGNYGKPPVFHALETHQGVKVATLVCYESEYGDYIRPLIRQGAGLIAVVTNDGWWNFGNNNNERQGSSGHVQHARLSVLRAIETRREVARSANTGTSMFINNLGRIRQPTAYWTEAVIDSRCRLYDAETFYVRYGDYIGWLSLLLSFSAMAFVWFRRRPGAAARG